MGHAQINSLAIHKQEVMQIGALAAAETLCAFGLLLPHQACPFGSYGQPQAMKASVAVTSPRAEVCSSTAKSNMKEERQLASHSVH